MVFKKCSNMTFLTFLSSTCSHHNNAPQNLTLPKGGSAASQDKEKVKSLQADSLQKEGTSVKPSAQQQDQSQLDPPHYIVLIKKDLTLSLWIGHRGATETLRRSLGSASRLISFSFKYSRRSVLRKPFFFFYTCDMPVS